MHNWTWLKDLIVLKPLPASILFLACLIVLIIPDKFATFLAIREFRAQYRPWISILTIIAGVTLLCHLIRYRFTQFKRWKMRREVIKQLFSLSPDERLILYFCIRNNSTTVYAPHGNSTLQALCSKGLMREGNGTGIILSWPYLIPQWIWKYLKQHSDNIFSEFKNLDQNELLEKVKAILRAPLF